MNVALMPLPWLFILPAEEAYPCVYPDWEIRAGVARLVGGYISSVCWGETLVGVLSCLVLTCLVLCRQVCT
jgi:hypothetical protein